MTPKYQAIADELRVHIQAGKYVNAQNAAYRVRHCRGIPGQPPDVRQALSVLAKEGLIEKRQGSGSHITRRETETAAPHRSIAVVTTYISDYIFPSILREVETVLLPEQLYPLPFCHAEPGIQ